MLKSPLRIIIFIFYIAVLLPPKNAIAIFHTKNDINAFISIMRQAGVTRQEINAIIEILPYNPEPNTAANNIQFLQNLGVRDIGRVVKSYPSILTLNRKLTLEPKIAWFESYQIRKVSKIIRDFPSLLGLSIEENLDPKIVWLQNLGAEDIPYLIETFPQILGLSLETLQKMANYLRDLRVTKFTKILKYAPQLFALDIHENLAPKVLWLQELGVSNIGKALEKFPTLLHYDLERNMKGTVLWLQKVGFSNIPKLISIFPNVFGYSLSENLAPKFDLLYSAWGITAHDIESLKPMLLGSSLDRIKALHCELVGLGINPVTLPLKTRINLAYSMDVKKLYDRLRSLKILKSSVYSSHLISAEEKQKLKKFFHSKKVDLLLRKEKISSSCDSELAT